MEESIICSGGMSAICESAVRQASSLTPRGVLDRCDDDVVLGAEVLVDRALADAGDLGDVVGGDGVGPDSAQQFARRGDDFATSSLSIAAAAASSEALNWGFPPSHALRTRLMRPGVSYSPRCQQPIGRRRETAVTTVAKPEVDIVAVPHIGEEAPTTPGSAGPRIGRSTRLSGWPAGQWMFLPGRSARRSSCRACTRSSAM